MNEEYKNIIKNQNLNELEKKDVMSIIFKNLDDRQWYLLNNEEQSEYNEKIVKTAISYDISGFYGANEVVIYNFCFS